MYTKKFLQTNIFSLEVPHLVKSPTGEDQIHFNQPMKNYKIVTLLQVSRKL